MDLLTWDERSVLTERGFLPSPAYDRLDRPSQEIDVSDRYRGVLVGLGVGDAMGKPIQNMDWQLIEQRHGHVNRYLSAPIEHFMLPPGQITDDTQQALLMASSAIDKARFVPRDLVQRLEALLPVARTAGPSTLAAIRALRSGMPWTHTGQVSAGHGALTRALIPPLMNPFDLDGIRTSEAIQTVITHADHSAVAASVATGAIVAHLLSTPPGHLDLASLATTIEHALVGVTDPVIALRTDGTVMSLSERLHQALDLGRLSAHEAYAKLGTGGFVLESLPLALWVFAHHAEDPVAAVILAVSAGGASSTIGGLAAAFAGAYHGASAFPDVWVDHLEYVDGLAGHADRLADQAGFSTPAEPFRAGDLLSPSAYAPFSLGGSTMPTIEHAIRASAAPDPTASVKMRLAPTPADARRLSVLTPARPDWPAAAPGLVAAILKRRFAAGGSAADRLARASVDDVRDAARSLLDEPFDYARLLEEQRTLVATG